MHSGGSLTKYWAYGANGVKVRGLELRQHSTCQWIVRLQEQALDLLSKSDDLIDGIPSYRVQREVQSLLIDAIQRLERHQLLAKDLIITQRIAALAFQRSERLGLTPELASKVRFVICSKNVNNPLERVLLAHECETTKHPIRNIDVDHYRRLAIRAVWAILAPFGWSEGELLETNITRLDQWA
jgi:DNA polymerase I